MTPPFRIREDQGRWLIEEHHDLLTLKGWPIATYWRPIVTHHRTEASAREHLEQLQRDEQ